MQAWGQSFSHQDFATTKSTICKGNFLSVYCTIFVMLNASSPTYGAFVALFPGLLSSFRSLQAIENWTVGRPGNKASAFGEQECPNTLLGTWS